MILTATASRRFQLQDVAELREWTQQLPALDRRTRPELAGGSNAEERVRNRFAKRSRIPAAARSREERPGERRIDLVDVDRRGFRGSTEPDVAPRGADVPDRHGHLTRQLALNVG